MKLLKLHFKDHLRRSSVAAAADGSSQQVRTAFAHNNHRQKRSTDDKTAENVINFDMDELWSQLPEDAAESASSANHLILVSNAILTLELELDNASADNIAAAGGDRSYQVCAVQIVRDLDGIRLDCVDTDADEAADAADNKIRVEVDISHAVQAWLIDESTNKGLLIQADGWHVSKAKQPIRIQFTTIAAPRLRNVRAKRDLYLSQEFLQQFMQAEGPPAKSECKKGTNGRKCCRQHMKVELRNFEGLDFILQPQEFDAYYCVGKCPARYLPRNDHTLLQSLIHIQSREAAAAAAASNGVTSQPSSAAGHHNGGLNIKKPCCNPSEYESIDILYLNENDPTKLEVKHWKNIIVSECACA